MRLEQLRTTVELAAENWCSLVEPLGHVGVLRALSRVEECDPRWVLTGKSPGAYVRSSLAARNRREGSAKLRHGARQNDGATGEMGTAGIGRKTDMRELRVRTFRQCLDITLCQLRQRLGLSSR